jgi:hypothetical protein
MNGSASSASRNRESSDRVATPCAARRFGLGRTRRAAPPRASFGGMSRTQAVSHRVTDVGEPDRPWTCGFGELLLYVAVFLGAFAAATVFSRSRPVSTTPIGILGTHLCTPRVIGDLERLDRQPVVVGKITTGRCAADKSALQVGL